MFIGIVALFAFYEGGVVGIMVTFAMAMVDGMLNRFLALGPESNSWCSMDSDPVG
ncbi:hypothetical protein [Oceanobacillus sojae]|uniref:hypothetical protein n=1 Tax=Oceanobacillus sojae TaxID=582851 RepID=UPI0036D4315C